MPWTRKRTSPETAGLLLEHADELLSDDRALLLRLGHAREPREEPLARVDVDERDVEVVAERLDHLLGLVLAQEAVVDEHARELVADRLVHEERRDRGVDASGQPADDPLGADLGADPLDLLLDHSRRRPCRGRAGDVVEEALQHPLALGRVDDLGMELDAVPAVLGVLERRDRGRLRRGRDARARRRRRDGVAVAHPHHLLAREVVEQRGGSVELDVRLAVLGDVVRLHGPAELAGHQLHPVADPERRHAELEDRGIRERRSLRVDGGGPAGEDQRGRVPRLDLAGAEPVRDELRVDAGLAHAAGDELAVLAAEVEHEHGTLLRGRLGPGERDHLGRLTHGGSSARPS